MKDAYSFDVTDEAAMVSYHKMYDAYKRIFHRCGLRTFPGEADTGVIGGNYSHEFMVPAETGENDVVYLRRVQLRRQHREGHQRPAQDCPTRRRARRRERFPTPGVVTIEALSRSPTTCRQPADQDAGLYRRQQAGHPADPRRRPVERDQVHGPHWRGRRPGPATPEECFATLGAKPGSLGAV
jgi:prolyl-tRNA synthetase